MSPYQRRLAADRQRLITDWAGSMWPQLRNVVGFQSLLADLGHPVSADQVVEDVAALFARGELLVGVVFPAMGDRR